MPFLPYISPELIDFLIEKEKNEQKIGSIVKHSINEFRENLKEEKEKLKNEFFEPDK